jgi:CheY-like chemotaxis protein
MSENIMPHALPRKSILIVEDEILVAMDIERILVDAGYNVVAIAADRNEAVAAAPQAAMAFVDLNLRDGLTGPTVARCLADQYGIRVIYVTANPAQIDETAATAVGYIRKPFSEPAILAAANVALGIAADDAHEDLVRL